jgi:hypothetical protein
MPLIELQHVLCAGNAPVHPVSVIFHLNGNASHSPQSTSRTDKSITDDSSTDDCDSLTDGSLTDGSDGIDDSDGSSQWQHPISIRSTPIL